jgi:hypothetical protein
MKTRLGESVAQCLKMGNGLLFIVEEGKTKTVQYSKQLMCLETGLSYEEPSPNSFSFNSPYGACPTCKGLGNVYAIDLGLIMPDTTLSINEGAIHPLGEAREASVFTQIKQFARKHKISMDKAIKDLSKEQLDSLKDKNIVGCDPGKRSLVYMMDKNGKKLQYTAPQRKRESKAKTNQRILLEERKRKGIIEKETQLSFQNSKSVDYVKFKLYLVEKNKLNKETTEFYKKEVWRKMKFRQYSYGKKSIDIFLNKIKETFGENILIGYGNWSRSSQMKHFMPTMNKGLRKLIHKKYDTITINECNTSKKCCDCNKDLEYYKDKEGKKVFRLLKCSNCVSCENKKTVFRIRDANSSINIMKLTSCWIEKQERPLCFHISSFTSSNTKKEEEKVRPS